MPEVILAASARHDGPNLPSNFQSLFRLLSWHPPKTARQATDPKLRPPGRRPGLPVASSRRGGVKLPFAIG